MPLDPNIILAGTPRPTATPDFGQAVLGGMNNALALQQQQMKTQGMMRLRDIAGSVDPTTEEGQKALVQAQAATGDVSGAINSTYTLARSTEQRALAAKNVQMAMQAIGEGSRKHIADSAQRAGAQANAALADPNPDNQKAALAAIGQQTIADMQPREADDPGTAYAKAHALQQWGQTLQRLQTMSPQEVQAMLQSTALSGRSFSDWQVMQKQSDSPLSAIAKIRRDQARGLISAEDAAAMIRKETTIQPNMAAIMMGGDSGLSADTKAMLVNKYLTTGVLDSDISARNPGLRNEILNAAAAKLKENGATPDLGSAKADFKANQASLTNIQKQRDQIVSFENTALKNLGVFEGLAKNMVDTSSPILNKPVRYLAAQAAGSPGQAAANAALQTVIPEFAKINSGAMGNAAVSDSTRHEIANIMRGDATLGQILAVSRVLRQDAANRHQSLDQQLSEIRGRIGGSRGAASSTPPTITNQKDYDALPVGAPYVDVNGVPHKKGGA